MTDLFVDTSTFLLAVGGEHPKRAPCRRFLSESAERGVVLHASVEVVQEFVFHRMRRVDRDTASRQTAALTRAIVTHPFDDAVLAESVRLIGSTSLRGRDAVHVATARLAGFDTIVSLDHDYDGVDEIGRVDPAEALR